VQSSSASLVAGHSHTLNLLSHDDNYASDPTYTLFDDVGLAAPPTPDFTISASPASQTVVQGSSPSYTVTVTPLRWHHGHGHPERLRLRRRRLGHRLRRRFATTTTSRPCPS